MFMLNFLKRAAIFLAILLLVLQQFPSSVKAISDDTNGEETAIIFATDSDSSVSLHAADSFDSEVLTPIHDDTEVTLIESESEEETDFTFIHYTINESGSEETFRGYVANDYIYSLSDATDYRNSRLEENNLQSEDEKETEMETTEPTSDSSTGTSSIASTTEAQKTLKGIALKDATLIYAEQSTNSASLKAYSKGSILIYRTLADNWYEATVYINGSPKTGYINASDVENAIENQQTQMGIAEQTLTPIYSNASTNSQTLKTYNQGSVLQYKTFSTNWYEAIVYVNGGYTTGYISKQDIEEPVIDQESSQGIATQSPTKVYSDASTSSKTLKSYSQGTTLKYKTFTSDWYEATVYLNGKATTGYIHKNHVEEPVTEQKNLIGIAKQASTKIYSKASTSSSTLKAYVNGTILKYKTYISGWYEATVFINGKPTTGYIHKDHVEEPVANQQTLEGIGTQSSTNVYSDATTSSKMLKSYSQGTLLKYKTFSSNWYEATIYLNGKATTGYIHKDHVEEPVANPTSLEGIGTKAPTRVYSNASTGSKTLKSYSQGSVLKYETYTSDWYQATVYLNGKATTGYIHKDHVEEPVANPKNLEGIGVQTHTRVYSNASTSSKILKSYSQGTVLKYKTFTTNWYQATVYLNGKATTGYIHTDQVEEPVANPKSLTGIGKKNPTRIYTKASTSSNTIKTYAEGSVLQYKTYTSNWYEAVVYVNGKAQTGYIHKSHILNEGFKQTNLEGTVLKPTIHVYSDLDKSSQRLKSYRLADELKFKSYTDNWYEATVYVNGKAKTGYINKSDISNKVLNARSIVNPNQTYTYNEMMYDINALKNNYPGLISTESIGRSVEGRNIPVVKLGVGKTKITINASHHAREWMTTNLVMYQIDQYSQSFVKDNNYDGYDVRDLLTKVTIYYVPMVNPDGVTLNQSGPSGFSNEQQLINMNNGSRNFSTWKANSRGVDLNRQYPAGWNTIKNTSRYPSGDNYKGTRPLSEPETQALYNFTLKHDFKTYVAYHSSGEILYWAYNATGSQQTLNRRIANMISNKTGYSLVAPSINPSGGGYTDWVIDALKKPGFTPEISPYTYSQPVPLSNFSRIWKQNNSIGLMLAEEAYKNRNNR